MHAALTASALTAFALTASAGSREATSPSWADLRDTYPPTATPHPITYLPLLPGCRKVTCFPSWEAYGSSLLLAFGSLTVMSAPSTAAAPPAGELCAPGSAINFDRSAFPESPRIDNKWFPLKPGMQFTTLGTVTSAEGVHERKVIHTVTGLTKVIDGVTTRVMWDRDYADGELVESELAFFAQTRAGAVWLFGEYPEEYENGEFVGAPSTFISGLAKAQAGIAMPARPQTGTASYVQAYAPKVDFLDCGTVFQKNQEVCVPTGCYDDVLVIDEYNPLEPPEAGHQRKFY